MTSDFTPPAELPKAAPVPSETPLQALRQIIFSPTQAFQWITAQQRKATWVLPIVLIGVLLLASTTIAATAPARVTFAGGGSVAQGTQTTQRTTTANRQGNNNQGQQFPGGPPGGDFGGPGQVIIQGGGFPGGVPGAAGTTTTRTTTSTNTSANLWVSLLGGLGGFLVAWLATGVLANLLTLAFGGHSSALMAMNVTAWAAIPLGLRNLMRIFYYLATGNAVQMPGLAGFITSTTGNNALFFAQSLLSQVDLYLVWQVALLAIGVSVWGKLTRKKTWLIAGISILIVLLLQAGIALGMQALGSMNINLSMLGIR